MRVLNKNFMILILLVAWSSIVNGQTFHNLAFEQECHQSKTGLCTWDLSWGKQSACTQDTSNTGYCLLVQSETTASVVFVEQSAECTANEVQIIELSARIKSEGIEGKGAGLNCGLYDFDGNLIATKDMGGFYSLDWIKGTTEWNHVTLSMVCPSETSTIKIGFILYGKGKAWIDDFHVSILPVSNRTPSAVSMDYITAACDTIAKHSLVRDSLDIHDLKDIALRIAGSAKSDSDCYLAVNFLLESLRSFGDHHSFFMTAREVSSWEGDGAGGEVDIDLPIHRRIDSCGYIAIPGFHAGDSTLSLVFADAIQEAIQFLFSSSINGWIIDLRENSGGNMEPMIAGLGPLFDSGSLGSLVDVNGEKESWEYKDGVYYWESEQLLAVSNPVVLPAKLPIAVLTSPRTGSSGEIVVISFVGNSLTKSFGQPTWGLTTGNGGFDLPDGARMMLASTTMSDRKGTLYLGPIVPDAIITTSSPDETDLAVQGAIDWIKRQKP